MVNNNKILTVSYGTFSCTLEGFEDSFGTMKAIAEYFRDLAADDRYFGAEPPQPDADMLARIAQNAIARQVEAHRDGDGIVLRAAEQAAPAALAATDAIAPETVAPAAEAPVETPVVETPADVNAPEIAPVAEAAPEVSAPVDATPAPMTEAFTAPVEVAAPDPAVEVETPPAPTPAPVAPVAEPVAEAAPTQAPDSIAAKLQRIRAVVSQNKDEAPGAYTEDQHADTFMSDTVQDIAAALEEDDASEPIQSDTADFDPDDGADDLNDALDRLDSAAEQMAPTDAPQDDGYDENYEDATDGELDGNALTVLDVRKLTADTTAPDNGDEVVADTGFDQDMSAEDFGDAAADGQLSDDISDGVGDADAATEQDADLATEADQPDAADEPLSDRIDLAEYAVSDDAAPEVEEQPEDFAAVDDSQLFADLDGDDEDLEPDEIANILDDDAAAPEEQPQADIESSLSPEDEADLLRELAEVSSEATDSADAAELDDENGAALLRSSEEPDDDVSRLMAAAEEKMGTPESSTSRETYSHLRAAVAVAQAERSAGRNVGDDSGDDVYREDLANVVRPRRPVAHGGTRPERPDAAAQAAPLKLVAEQRVDLEDSRPAGGPVRPRRVASDETEAASGSAESGFAEFAAQMGATELPDLLEAAASYMSFVEGRDQFSRPQLMRKLRQLDSYEFNREDGLRSFGQLLREGKIEKTGAGGFTASGDIGFRPGERAAG